MSERHRQSANGRYRPTILSHCVSAPGPACRRWRLAFWLSAVALRKARFLANLRGCVRVLETFVLPARTECRPPQQDRKRFAEHRRRAARSLRPQLSIALLPGFLWLRERIRRCNASVILSWSPVPTRRYVVSNPAADSCETSVGSDNLNGD